MLLFSIVSLKHPVYLTILFSFMNSLVCDWQREVKTVNCKVFLLSLSWQLFLGFMKKIKFILSRYGFHHLVIWLEGTWVILLHVESNCILNSSEMSQAWENLLRNDVKKYFWWLKCKAGVIMCYLSWFRITVFMPLQEMNKCQARLSAKTYLNEWILLTFLVSGNYCHYYRNQPIFEYTPRICCQLQMMTILWV